ncbi:MAG: GTPase ObgE, partial [candidate division KSB1 bacterium]|nr:GTPase ObgE [candidate division KSB1 bacterium]
EAIADDMQATYETLLAELAGYNRALLDKPRVIVVTKSDLATQENPGEALLRQLPFPCCRISAVTGEGLPELLDLLWAAVQSPPPGKGGAD